MTSPASQPRQPVTVTDQVRQIFARSDASGKRRPGRPALARQLGVTQHQVRRALADLERQGSPTHQRPASILTFPDQGTPTVEFPAVTTTIDLPAAPAPGDMSRQPGEPPERGQHQPGASAGGPARQPGERIASGRDLVTTVLFYLTASVGLLFSADSSYLLASGRLGLHGLLLWVLFGFLELFGLAGAAGLAAAARRGEHGGVYRLVVWGVVAYNVYSALMVASPGGAIARVVASLVGVLALHLALGTEIRRARRQVRSPLAWLARAHWLFFPWRSVGTLLRVASAHANAARARELAAIGDQG